MARTQVPLLLAGCQMAGNQPPKDPFSATEHVNPDLGGGWGGVSKRDSNDSTRCTLFTHPKDGSPNWANPCCRFKVSRVLGLVNQGLLLGNHRFPSTLTCREFFALCTGGDGAHSVFVYLVVCCCVFMWGRWASVAVGQNARFGGFSMKDAKYGQWVWGHQAQRRKLCAPL